MIEPQGLDTVGKALAGKDQLVKLFNDRHLDVVSLAITAGIVVAGTVQIRIEDTRHAVLAQEDQRIGQRFKPGLDRGLQRL
ncbi:hypothetical protein D3C75_936400 [compost metagenome]